MVWERLQSHRRASRTCAGQFSQARRVGRRGEVRCSLPQDRRIQARREVEGLAGCSAASWGDDAIATERRQLDDDGRGGGGGCPGEPFTCALRRRMIASVPGFRRRRCAV